MWNDSQNNIFENSPAVNRIKKEQSDSYDACGYGGHHANWGRLQQQGGINGYS